MSTVSVIIPAYNQAQYLASAVESVLAQSYPAVEIIVVDDGSTDETRSVAERFAGPQVRYIYQRNQGLSAARNTGIRHAQGELLSYLDSDDLFLPDKLALLTAELDRRPELGLVAGQAIPIDEEGRRFGKVYDTPPPDDGARLLLGNPLHVGSVLVRRRWQERAGLFDETLRSYEDWDMWLRLARAGCPLGWVAQPVSLYRFHRAQMTRDMDRMTTATFAVLQKVFADPDLPPAWRAQHDAAYSGAHMRAAAQGYANRDFERAKSHLREAVRLQPALLDGDGASLAARISAWTDSPKIADRAAHLAAIYANLPEEMAALGSRGAAEIAAAELEIAYAARDRADWPTARSAALAAVRRCPRLLANRGALALLARSWLQAPTAAR